MIDIIIHEGNSFKFPSTLTTDNRISICQAYIGLFLTYIGSVEEDPLVGSIFELGKSNIVSFTLSVQRINSDVYSQMRKEYDIKSITLSNIVPKEDGYSFTVNFTRNNGEINSLVLGI